MAPSGIRRSRFAREPDETRRQATRHVEEVQLLDVCRQPAEFARERGEECVADRRFGRDQLAETLARQDDRLGRDEGRGAGRSRRAIEQGQLAEHVALVERREDRLLARFGRDRDLHLAGHDDEQGVARIAGVEDHLASPEAPRPGARGDPFEGVRVQPREERDAGKRRDERATGQHVGAS